MAGERTRADVLRSRALIILGLSGLAVTQPLLDLFGNNPEFFVAGNYSRGQIIAFALLVVLVPPLVGIGLTAAATFIDRWAGTIVFAVVSAALAGAFVLAVLRTLDVDATVVVFAVAVVAGVGIAVLVVRTRGAQLFVSYLAAANLLFLGSFLFLSPTSELVAGGSAGDVDEVDVPAPEGPVVVIVLDEFPASTIMRGDGSLNAERYPGFAQLAAASTWFRNASSRFNLTHRAVPMILSGVVGGEDDLPTYQDHPRTVFSLLGRRRPGPPLRGDHRPVPAISVRPAASPAAQPGDRGRVDRVRPPGAAELAAGRVAGDRQLVGRVRGRGRGDGARRSWTPRTPRAPT